MEKRSKFFNNCCKYLVKILNVCYSFGNHQDVHYIYINPHFSYVRYRMAQEMRDDVLEQIQVGLHRKVLFH